MSTSWGATGNLLRKDVRKEERELSSAGTKSGLAGALGGFGGGMGLLALMNPGTALGMGMTAAAGSIFGSGIGRQLLTSKKTKDTLRGTGDDAFLKGDR